MAKMTDDEILALMMLLITERPLHAREIGVGLTGMVVESEPARTIGMAALRGLERGGAARRIAGSHSPWHITEKGRIAAALLMYKNPELREVFIDAWTEEAREPGRTAPEEARPAAGGVPPSRPE